MDPLYRLMYALAGWPLDEDGHIARKDLPDGRSVVVVPLTYGRARVAISDDPKTGYQAVW